MSAIEVDREGDFQVEAKDYMLAESASGSVNLSMVFRILNVWDEESQTWSDWTKDEAGNRMEIVVSGLINLIKKKTEDGKSGGINERQCDSLIEYCGWNGSMTSLADKSWKPTNCQVKVTEEEYRGKKSYKVAWVNAFDSVPGGAGRGLTAASAEAAQRLQDQWGASLRALAGKAKDKVQRPAGKPAPPTKAAPPVAAGANAAGGEIPF